MYSQANIKPFSTQTIQELDPFRSVYQLQSGNAYPWYGAKAYNPFRRAASPPRSPSGSSSFGKKRKRKKSRKGSKKTSKKKKAVAYCIKKNRVVKVYRKTGKTGRYYYDGKKVKKGQKCYKLKSKAKAALKNRPKRRKSSSSSNTKYYYVINGKNKKQPSWKKGYKKYRRPSCSKYDKELTCTPAKAGCKWTSSGCVNKFGSSFGAPAYNYTMSQYANNVSTPTNHLLGKITGTSAYSYPTNRPNYHFYDQNINNSGYGF